MTAEEVTPDHSATDTNRVIQGLWIGPELSVMEQLSIASFMQNGHEYHLYVYNELKNVPVGAVIKDGNEILPSSRIFQYKHFPTYAGFANFFRYKLLLERGGWWADTDTVCLKRFDFSEEHVFATERVDQMEVVTSGIIKAPAGSPVMSYAWEVCQAKKPEDLVWGETGPRLMGEVVKKFSLELNTKPYQCFCPLSYSEWNRVLDSEPILLDERAYAIHLWNERWRATGQNKNAQYHPDCLYEILKRRYSRVRPVQASSHP